MYLLLNIYMYIYVYICIYLYIVFFQENASQPICSSARDDLINGRTIPGVFESMPTVRIEDAEVFYDGLADCVSVLQAPNPFDPSHEVLSAHEVITFWILSGGGQLK